MQRGHMRFEPNINVVITTDDGVEHATPIVEVKNLNSFRALRGAIECESVRQVKAWKEDGREMGPGMKSTRGWDDQAMQTVLQREKEDAHDYRYFPDPDLVPLTISQEWIDEVNESIPELPASRRRRYRDSFGLSAKDAAALANDADTCRFFEASAEASGDGAGAAKWLLNAGAKRANELGVVISELGITPEQVAGIIALRAGGAIGSSAADELFGLLCDRDEAADVVAEEVGLMQVRDDAAMAGWIDEAIEAQPAAASDFKGGKDAAVGRLVGEVMKRSGGTADAGAVREALHGRLRGGDQVPGLPG